MWEIYAYQNADSLFGVFNAAAAIHSSGDYAAAMAAVAFCGFVAALVAYAFAPEKLQGWKWLGTVVLVFSVLIVPKVTVGIVDKTGGSAVKVVGNVPFGVAALGGITSTIGNTLTSLFETAFQVIPGVGALPVELSYQQNGLMFGNRLIRETGNVVFQDPAFRTDLINFIHNCTTYDLIDGTLDPAVFSASDDVWPLMASPNPARWRQCRRRYLPQCLSEPQWPLAGPDRPHPGASGFSAQSDTARRCRCSGHRRTNPAGLYQEQHRHRGSHGGRHHPAERHAQRA